MNYRELRKSVAWTMMVLILVAGFAVRVYNINFDRGMGSHPDERSNSCFMAPSIHLPTSWAQFWEPKQSPLNPLWNVERQERRSYTYGHLPLYLGVAMGEVLHWLSPVAEQLGVDEKTVALMARADAACDGFAVAGRFVIALFDTLTILLLYLLGCRIYGRGTGVLGAAFYALTAQAIQLSHFFAMDPASTTFTVLAVLGSVKMAQERSLRAALLCGLGAGLAISSKFSALPILAVPFMGGLLGFWLSSSLTPHPSPLIPLTDGRARFISLLSIPLALIVAALTFAITSPYAVLDAQSFLQATIVEQGRMVRGLADFPFTRQYRNTTPYLYFIQQQLEWGLGWPLGIVTALGTLFALYQLIVGIGKLGLRLFSAQSTTLSPIEVGVILMWSWVLPYFGITGAFLAKFNRYMIPLLPFVVLWGAGLIVWLWNRKADKVTGWQGDKVTSTSSVTLSPRHPVTLSRLLSLLLAIVGLAGALFWSAAYVNGVYRQDHPWITAARWMKENVPAGSVILCEQWDDCLPFGSFGEPEVDQARGQWSYSDWGPYEEDTAEKYQLMKEKLKAANFVIYSSKRIYDSVDELPERYPMTNLYYKSMWDGSLGFELAFEAVTQPELFGFKFEDRHADESWSLYDHAQVSIFRKVRELSDAEWDAKFAGTWENAKLGYRGKDSPLSPLLNRLGLGNSIESENSGLINRVVGMLMGVEPPPPAPEDRASMKLEKPLNELPVVDNYRWNRLASESTLLAIGWWWLVVTLLGWVAWPLAFALFRPLRDRGYFFSRGVGWLLAGWLLWIAASSGLLLNSVRNAWLMVGVVLLLSIAATIRQRKSMAAFLRQNLGLLLAAELLFAIAYLFFVLVRMGNPDLWQPWFGGEKFMEFAFLNGILRSPTFPPLDPHYAGYYINYYYFGLYLVAYLVKLTGIYAEVAFNLAIPTLFALTVMHSFGVAYSAYGRQGGKVQDASDLQPATARLSSPNACNLQPWRTGFASALLAPLFVTLIGNLDGLAYLLRRLAEAGTSSFQSASSTLQTVVQAASGARNLQDSVGFAGFLQSLDYWVPSRVLPATINEFPYWSFLFADLHPHLIGIPMAALFIGVVLALLSERKTLFSSEWPRGLLLLAFLSLLLGTLASINLWELPTYLGLGILALLVAQVRWRGAIDWWLSALLAILYGVGAYLLFLPFFRNFHNVGASGVGMVRQPDDPGTWLLIWGFLGFAVVAWLFYEAARPARRVASGEWRVAGGEWRVAGGEWRVASGESVLSPSGNSGGTDEPVITQSQTHLADEPSITPSDEPEISLIEFELDNSTQDTHLSGSYISDDEPVALPAPRPSPLAPLTSIERWLSLVMCYFDRLPRLIYLNQQLVTQPSLSYLAAQWWLLLIPLLVILLWWRNQTILALCLLPVGLGWLLLWRRGRAADAGSALGAILAFTGAIILAGTQVVYLKDFLSGGDWYRMNTLFKFFSQVWVIWGIAAAVGAARMWNTRHEIRDTRYESSVTGNHLVSRISYLVFLLLLIASLVFPFWGTPVRINQRFPGWRPEFGTLNALDYMRGGSYTWNGRDDVGQQIPTQLVTELKYDRDAIDWLLAHVRGNPVIAESAEIDYYRAGGTRAATMTGLSGPVGQHKNEQHYGEETGARLDVYKQFWATPDVARTLQLIDELQIALIYVGQLERYQHPAGVAKVEQMAANGQLELLYQNEKTILYAVPNRLTQTAQGDYIPASAPQVANKNP